MTKVILIDGPFLHEWERASLTITWILRQNFMSYMLREGRLSEFTVREFDRPDEDALRSHGFRVKHVLLSFITPASA